jgi:hypothetical protein
MSDATPPPASFLGHCTPENINNADAILTNDLFDDSGSYNDGEDTDNDDNFQLLIKAANSDKDDDSDDDDDDDNNGYIFDDEDEVENLREDQKMPTELWEWFPFINCKPILQHKSNCFHFTGS